MNIFTNNFSRKGIGKRFLILFLTFFALGFTVNAQIPKFTEILKQYYNTNNIVLKTTSQTPPYGEQFENYDFESWENEGEESVEPTQWNSFMTAETSWLLSSAKSQQIDYSSEIRPNSSGSRSARIYARSVAGIVANGNVTNGRIYAGSMTANNDKNYNYTVRSDANFNTTITSIPDSLTVWVAFRSKSAATAKINVTIHGDTDLKQLAKSGNSPTNMVCATADIDYANTCISGSDLVWKRLTVPFVNGSHTDPRYILATFTTNKTPGGGTSGDEVFVDDICLIYNPSLNINYSGQTEFIVDGSAVNIQIPFTLDGSMSVYNLNSADNVVIAQLSDANGSFANPIELGRVTTNVSGTIQGVIPETVLAGKGYRIRVVSTNYPMVSEDNGTDIVIRNIPRVEIALGTVGTKSAAATFTPNSACSKYYYAISTNSNMNANAVKANGTLQTGSLTKTWDNLISNTAYTIYVLPLDADGNVYEMKTVALTTNAFVPQVSIAKGTSATKSITATFTPNADCAKYYYAISNKSNMNVDAVKAEGTLQTGNHTKTWDNLVSNTEYTIYALPIDVDGNNGTLKTLNVKTDAFNPQIDITRGNVAAKSITATLTPNAECVEYYFLIATASESVDVAYIKTNGEKQTETYTKTWDNLVSNTEYTIYALPVDVDGFGGTIKTANIKTNALASQVEIAKGEVSTKSITVTLTPNADCVEYYFLIAANSESVDAESLKANGEKQTASYTATWENLISNTEYVVYALPIDVEGNNGLLKTLNVKTEAFNPQIEIARGNVSAKSISANFTPNADCAEYYILIEESSVTVDEEYIKTNGEKQTATFAKTWDNLTSNTEYTIYALSVDVDGFSGNVKNVTLKTNALVPQVEIIKGKVETYSFAVNFTPNTDCLRYYFLLSTEPVDADYIMENGEERTGETSQLWESLSSSTEYTVYVLPIDIEGNEGEIKSLVVKTKVEAGVSEVEIDIVKLSETSVEITATPNENTVLYHYIVMTKAEADAMGEEALKQRLDENENYLTDVEVETMTVESNVAYYVLAQGKNADDKWGEITKEVFTVSGPAFVAIEVENLSETEVSVTATPNENTVSYRYIVIEKSEADSMEEEVLMQRLAETGELSGIDVWTWEVKPNIEYYVIAQGKNADGRLGEMSKVEFVVAGAATVAIAIEELSATSVEIVATPNENAVCYHYIIIEKAEADAMGNDALMQRLAENEEYLEGVTEKEMTVKSNVEYYVVAQAKNADGKWGAVTYVDFMIEVAGPAVVTLEVEVMSETSVEVTATPNENTVAYHYIIIKKEEADAMSEDALIQILNENENYLTGVDVWTWTIETNVEYYVVAQAKNADEIWGEVTKVEFMAEQILPEIDIVVNELNDTKVSVKATPNEKAVAYHYIVMEKAEADAISEDELIQKLNDSYNYFEGVSVMNWNVKMDVAYYVIVQAKDSNDVWGEIAKVEFRTVPPALVNVSVKELDETTVGVTASPNRTAVAYHYTVVEKALVDSIGGEEIMQMSNVNYFEGLSMMTWTVEPNVAYYVVAQAKDAEEVWGEITKVEFIIGEVSDTTNVAELDNAVLEIYPNPASEYIRINSDVDIEELVIYSIDGKVVYAESVNQQETMIDVTRFAKGSYVVRMISNGKSVVRNIIVK